MLGIGLKSRRMLLSTAEAAAASSCRPMAKMMTRFTATGKGANGVAVHGQRLPATQTVNLSTFMT